MIERQSQAQWRADLFAQTSTSRVPLSASIELTWSCNLSCQHCYLGDLRQRPDFLPLDFLCSLLDQLAQAGCMSLVITGGEPLLHPHFADFYRRAVELGFFVSLFSNGSLVDEKVADLLGRYPPHHVEISLYGGRAETYAELTGDGAAFAKVVRGIDLLNARGVDFRLKAVLQSGLLDDLPAMRHLAAEYALDLSLDPAVDGDFSGNTKTHKNRVDINQAVNLEFGEARREQKMCQYNDEHAVQAQSHNLSCGAAHSACHIDPGGFLMPCVMLRKPAVDLHAHDFLTAWEHLAKADPVRHSEDSPCATCEIQHLCNYCPGVDSHVSGDLKSERAYYCAIAQARALRLDSTNGSK